MNRRVALSVLAGAFSCVLFAAVSTSAQVDLGGWPSWTYLQQDELPLVEEPPPIIGSLPITGEEPTPVIIPDWLETLLELVLYAIGIVAIVLAVVGLVTAWRRRPRLRWHRQRSTDPGFEVLPDVAAAVVDEAAAQRAELLTGEPRNAIVRCWLRLEHDVATAGLSRHPADTSAEFTERVLAAYSVDDEAIRELATRYREARFSEHTLDETSRRSALEALDRLHRSLSSHDADPVRPAAESSR